jgi:hypothetical protein
MRSLVSTFAKSLQPTLIIGLFAFGVGACVYSSSAPPSESSGKTVPGDGVDQATDGTDPATDGGTSGNGSDGGGSKTGTDAGSGNGGVDGGGTKGTDAGNGGVTAPTWTEIYAGYFGPSGIGHCGNSGCHASSRGGFKCGTTQATCYSGLVAAALVNTSSPSSSTLIDPQQSPLSWYGGNMPGSATTNAKAVSDIDAWVKAGAQNN